jgi:nicotinamidase-related amidase
MNAVAKAARSKGVTIIHSPSETMPFYKDHPARKRMIDAPHADMPKEAAHDVPPQPVDSSDGGSDTGEKPWYRAWTRQHPGIEIDEQKDGISDNGQEIWNFLKQNKIKNLIIMGVHTNMCVLNRPFAIEPMVRRCMNVFLVRDMTDAMYNPARPPYVSHEEGTRLVIEYIEKFWCPTIASEDMLKGQ